MAEIDILLCTSNRDDSELKKTLSSIHLSVFRDVRVLLVNDSCEPLPGNLPSSSIGVKIINLEESVGLTRALKVAEKHIDAPLVARMDCGDTMHPSRLEKQRCFLEVNMGCVLVGASSELFVKTAGGIRLMGRSLSSDDIRDMNSLLLYRNPFVHGSIMFRFIDFSVIGGYDSRYAIAQDFNLYMRIRSRGRLHILSDNLYTHVFKINQSNTIRKNKASVFSCFRSRVSCMSVSEFLSLKFIFGVFRDVLILLLPKRVVVWLRFERQR